MSKQNDGGPAFPETTRNHFPHGPDGGEFIFTQTSMSLRDWFAGQALIGMLAGPEPIDPETLQIAANNGISPGNVMAGIAYSMADAMLAERERDE